MEEENQNFESQPHVMFAHTHTHPTLEGAPQLLAITHLSLYLVPLSPCQNPLTFGLFFFCPSLVLTSCHCFGFERTRRCHQTSSALASQEATVSFLQSRCASESLLFLPKGGGEESGRGCGFLF